MLTSKMVVSQTMGVHFRDYLTEMHRHRIKVAIDDVLPSSATLPYIGNSARIDKKRNLQHHGPA